MGQDSPMMPQGRIQDSPMMPQGRIQDFPMMPQGNPGLYPRVGAELLVEGTIRRRPSILLSVWTFSSRARLSYVALGSAWVATLTDYEFEGGQTQSLLYSSAHLCPALSSPG